MHRQPRDLNVVNDDFAAVDRNEADHHIKARRFARAVRSEQSDDLARAYLERDLGDDASPMVLLDESFGRERAHGLAVGFAGCRTADTWPSLSPSATKVSSLSA